MLEGLLRLLWCLVLHVAVALGQVGVEPIHGHVNHFDFAIGGEDLLNMFLHRTRRHRELSLLDWVSIQHEMKDNDIGFCPVEQHNSNIQLLSIEGNVTDYFFK